MKMKKIDEFRVGVYRWKLDNGQYLTDEEGSNRYLMVASEFGDLHKINALRKAAAHYGHPNGHAEFVSGSRPVGDEEYNSQVDRLKEGLIPDEYDLGSLYEDRGFLNE